MNIPQIDTSIITESEAGLMQLINSLYINELDYNLTKRDPEEYKLATG